MPITLVALLSLHVLASIFWAGSTFMLARTGGVGSRQMLAPLMGAALVVFLTGLALWSMLHSGSFGTSELVLCTGVATVIIGAGTQTWLRNRPAVAHRICAALQAVTAVCMVVARFV